MLDRWTRFAPLTGIVFVGLFIATFVVGGSTPGVHATGVKVISYYKAHHSGQKASAYLGVLAVVFLLFFATALRTYLRRVEAARPFAVLGFAGAIVLAMSGAIFSALSWALVDGRNTLDPSAAQALNVLSNDFFWPFAVGVAVFGMGYGLGDRAEQSPAALARVDRFRARRPRHSTASSRRRGCAARASWTSVARGSRRGSSPPRASKSRYWGAHFTLEQSYLLHAIT